MAVEYLGNGNPDGTSFGLSATEKISFFGATTVVKQAHIVDATDAATAITSLNSVIAALETYGLLATS